MMVQIPIGNKEIPGYLSKPEGPLKGGLLVIHEIWGLNDHIKDICNRFSKKGYVALAPDFLFPIKIEEYATDELQKEMADPKTRDEAQKKMRALLAPVHSPEFAQGMKEKLLKSFDFLLSQEGVTDIAVVGFCFGGTYSFVLATEQPKLKAAVPFYGHASEPLDQVEKIQCPVLAFYGEQDTPLIEALPEVKKVMKKNGKNFEALVYPDCGHAFFNDTNPNRYNKKAAEDAWEKTLAFLEKNI